MQQASDSQFPQLDNAIWNALNGRHAHLSIGGQSARRYDPAFSPLAGIRDTTSASFDALASLVSGQDVLGLSLPAEPVLPEIWDCLQKASVVQMVCWKLLPCREYDFQILDSSDVAEMTDLVKLTQPGPFAARTNELGTYIGIKDGARLVAMTGERMKVDGGFDEVSAVCTHPDYQGRGYARALVYAVSKLINERGHTPFLHVRAENAAAIKSYQAVGFSIRSSFWFGLLRLKEQKSVV